jgi:putative FmdB family regulatory protein
LAKAPARRPNLGCPRLKIRGSAHILPLQLQLAGEYRFPGKNLVIIFWFFTETAMPIYEYRCGSCGFQKEFLQKISDAPLTSCPDCGKETMNKLVTAAGFQLKGSGWYATDFRSGGKPSTKTESDTKSNPSAPACGAGACPACTT